MKVSIVLTGRDLVLQDITESNLAEIAVLANEPTIAANLKDVFPSPYSMEDARQFFTLLKEGKLGYVWGIFYRDNFAGVISIVPQQDIYRHSAEIGYWLGLPFQGKGIMTEAVRLVTEYTFKELNIYRIYAGVFAPNTASAKVLEKNGFSCESVKKKAVIKNGVLMDEHLFVKLNI
ncbi:MAG: GNAT family N-acetyltransferase [Chitinophagaceae bacterium]